MPIIRCSDQTTQSLREHYYDFTDGEKPMVQGQIMIKLIDKLDELFKETKIFGLTSIYHLNLLASDSYRTEWYVTFIVQNENEIYVEYLLPQEKRPWPFAKVSGIAKSIDEGIKFIIKGMKESQGWQNNQELEALSKTITL